MQVEFVINDGISLVLAPENDMEEALLKQMIKQHNDIAEIRNAVMVLNKTYKSGIIVGKKFLGVNDESETKKV